MKWIWNTDKTALFQWSPYQSIPSKFLVFVKISNMLIKGFDFVIYFIILSQKSSETNVRRTSEDEWLLEGCKNWTFSHSWLVQCSYSSVDRASEGNEARNVQILLAMVAQIQILRLNKYDLLFAQIPHIRCQAQPPWDVFYACSTRRKPTNLPSELLVVIFTVLLCLFANLALQSCKKGH